MGLFWDFANLMLLREFSRGHSCSPITVVPFIFHAVALVVAMFQTSIWQIMFSILSICGSYAIRIQWDRGVPARRETWIRQLDGESDVEYGARLEKERIRNSGDDAMKIRAPWLD
jgi:fatty acid desaturase